MRAQGVLGLGEPAGKGTGALNMKLVGCLARVLVFLILLPVVLTLPPVGFALFTFVVWTAYFLRKDQ